MVNTSSPSDETDESEWLAPHYHDDHDDAWPPRIDPSIMNDLNGHGHGKQAKIDYLSYLLARSPHVGCRFCDVQNASTIESSIPVWALQVMQPRPEGFVWFEESETWPFDPDCLGHICLGCYKRVLELQLERPGWTQTDEETEVIDNGTRALVH